MALVDRGPPGGTCVNLGCIPSKTLIYAADTAAGAADAEQLGIRAGIAGIDFSGIMERMRATRQRNSAFTRDWIRSRAGLLDFYEGTGEFVGDHTLEVQGTELSAELIFCASGARPLIPPVSGLESVDYLTSDTVLDLQKLPESLVIVGGGYIAAEYGHFFAAMGTRVTILQRGDRLVADEEPEISGLLLQEMQRRMAIATGTEAVEVGQRGEGCVVFGKDRATGDLREFEAEAVLVAAGRRSNADLLQVERTGVALDARGYIRTNEYLETNRENIWAVGDANGRQMFRHAASREALIAWQNATQEERVAMDYLAVPHAIYSRPQIASVGMTEAAARREHEVLVGRADYAETAMGEAMMEEAGFAKAIADARSGTILGFHIIGPSAPLLIQEVTNVIAARGTADSLGGIHIHPTLAELVPLTLRRMRAA
ncbi:dihydrolipoamide dehydrogenase [hydrocarbon metagenome]|uniref:Dihydrolipoamide dehydrogenase n=1 Tax=hydrocarbon metagenome TaxID=938273 RepID=A0A0W8FIY2_9ZZZZ